MTNQADEREAIADFSRLLLRCRTVLGNMALENEGAIFNRWPINHEPLRNDARHLVPLIDEALAKHHQETMDALRTPKPGSGDERRPMCKWCPSRLSCEAHGCSGRAFQPGSGAVAEPVAELERLRSLIGRPYVGAWVDEILIEAAHQRDRWGADQDHGKAPEDWFWLVGYLAGKALAAHKSGDSDKARHHTVSTAAVLAHWAAAISGSENVFRPGLGAEKIAGLSEGCISPALPPSRETLAREALENPIADQIIGQIEERFPDWRGFRDLIDCIDVTLHRLRGGS